MNRKPLKYISVIALLAALFYVASANSRPAVGKIHSAQLPDSVQNVILNTGDSLKKTNGDADLLLRKRQWLGQLQDILQQYRRLLIEPEDTLGERSAQLMRIMEAASAPIDSLERHNVTLPPASDTLPFEEDFARRIDQLLAEQTETPQDTLSIAPPAPRPARRPFIDKKMAVSAKDSLVHDVLEKNIYVYNGGVVDYGDMNLKSDFIRLNTETKEIFAHIVPDSLGKFTRTQFTQGRESIDMDTITYNIQTQRAIIRHASMKQGDGFMIGTKIKRQADNTFSASGGRYTTCDHIDHPHFYIEMNRAKVIPNKKVIMGRTHFVMEDVPIYFPFVPFGFFPLVTGRSSGFIVPTFGEEYSKGFFLRDGGYYFAFNDYIDVRATAGIYTLGSWNAALASRYIKRYTFRGSFNLRYSVDVIGQKGSADYRSGNNYSIQWTHSQDPRFRPNSSFSASVNYASSGFSRYSSTNMNDFLNTQINSSIAYSKSWPGKPYSFSTSFNHSQNSRDSTVSFTFPNASFNVSRITPFKRRIQAGAEKWYEKITMSYSGRAQGTINAKERDLFTSQTLNDMRSGISHSIPVSVSWNVLNFLNFTPNATYTERWYFQKITQQWDPRQNTIQRDTTYGFYRVFDYNASASLNTTIYGMFQFKGKNPFLRAVRHVITPSVSITYRPDFGEPRYGYYKTVQVDSTGTLRRYSPFESGIFGVPGSGQSASISFSLRQNLEAKIRSERDTTGERKIKIIDDFTLSGSYNMLADSMNLSIISFSFRTPIVKNYVLQISGSLDPYQVNENGQRTRHLLLRKGKLARLANASTSFSYTFNSSKSARPVMNDISSGSVAPAVQNGFFTDPNQQALDTEARRRMMVSQYYDFNLPWNFGINYGLSYSNNGIVRTVTQTLSFQGSVTPTEKWGINFSGGYDFRLRKMSYGSVSFNRDLHCWQMSLQWIPTGFMRSWSFNIRVKSNLLKDIKYDKHSSHYDNLYD